MKRSEELVGLSREHHAALSLALRARRAAAERGAAVTVMAERVARFFDSDLRAHFEAEECRLLPPLEQAGEAELVARTLADHRELKSLLPRVVATDAEALRAFADRLAAHVRFEERELFPAFEGLASPPRARADGSADPAEPRSGAGR